LGIVIDHNLKGKIKEIDLLALIFFEGIKKTKILEEIRKLEIKNKNWDKNIRGIKKSRADSTFRKALIHKELELVTYTPSPCVKVTSKFANLNPRVKREDDRIQNR